MLKKRYGLKVVNLVANLNLGYNLPLDRLASKLNNVEYNPEVFPGLIHKLPSGKATFLIFSNGKMVCTGCKSYDDINLAIDKIVLTLNKIIKNDDKNN